MVRAAASFAAAAITKSLTEALSTSKVVNDISASADADLKTENKGVADIVALPEDTPGDLLRDIENIG